MASPVRIALLIGQDFSYSRNVLRGIRRFAIDREHWVFRTGPCSPQTIPMLRAWNVAGIVLYTGDAPYVQAVRRLGKPVVYVSGILDPEDMAIVRVDDRKIGQMAAEHFIERGFQHFGYVGYGDIAYSRRRQAGFEEPVAAAGGDFSAFNEVWAAESTNRDETLSDSNDAMGQWIKSLPKPVAVLASNDKRAWQVLEVCRENRLRVPEDVAVCGVDDDDLVCGLARPALSSVAVPAERIGFEAAQMLDRMMDGEQSAQTVLHPPLGVVTRQSSDVLAIEDQDLLAALQYIRVNAHRPIGVEDLLRVVPSARRSLERKFRQHLGRTPLEEIRRAHLERARRLLAGTDLPTPVVAERSGFGNARWLATVFRKHMGMTPLAYRRRFRLHEAKPTHSV